MKNKNIDIKVFVKGFMGFVTKKIKPSLDSVTMCRLKEISGQSIFEKVSEKRKCSTNLFQ